MQQYSLLLMLLLTWTVVCHFLLRSAWSKIIVVVTAVILAIAKNGFRLFILTVLATYADPSFLHGWLHLDGGIVFFFVTSAILFLLLRLVVWVERGRDAEMSGTQFVG